MELYFRDIRNLLPIDEYERMIHSCLKLVVHIAKKSCRDETLLEDIIAEANRKLLRTVDRFDSTRGAKLSTYVAPDIKNAVSKAIHEYAKAIRVPMSAAQCMAHAQREYDDLCYELGREPLASELSAKSRVWLERKHLMSKYAMPIDEKKMGDYSSAPDRIIMADEQLRLCLDAMDSELSSVERMILGHYFGLNDAAHKTSDNIGEGLDLSGARVRQIRDEALAKIRKKLGVSVTKKPYSHV